MLIAVKLLLLLKTQTTIIDLFSILCNENTIKDELQSKTNVIKGTQIHIIYKLQTKRKKNWKMNKEYEQFINHK